MNPVRVLIVDDSALVRSILKEGLGKDPRIQIAGTANDPYQARDLIVKLRPDILTLDVEMPRMDGIAFLRRLMPQFPMPVVVVSSLTQKGKKLSLEAMEAGAVEVVGKPTVDIQRGLASMMQELREIVVTCSKANVSHWKGKFSMETRQLMANSNRALAESTDKVIAIGASTGGTEAIRQILNELPPDLPGIVIVQHMPPGFTRMFASGINKTSRLDVREARDGERILRGTALIAPGKQHMEVVRSGGHYQVKVSQGKPVNGHCPSVSVLFKSVAKEVGPNALGVMLTGMGRDGAKEMKLMKVAGAHCISQDEASSVVFGMPKAAVEYGGVDNVLPLDRISSELVSRLA